MHWDGGKAQSCIVQNFCTKCGQSLLSLPGISDKSFSFYYKRYNLTIRVVNFFETFCKCFPCSLGQDLIVKIAKKKNSFLFGLLELEMANVNIFFEKSDLYSLGVKKSKRKIKYKTSKDNRWLRSAYKNGRIIAKLISAIKIPHITFKQKSN